MIFHLFKKRNSCYFRSKQVNCMFFAFFTKMDKNDELDLRLDKFIKSSESSESSEIILQIERKIEIHTKWLSGLPFK